MADTMEGKTSVELLAMGTKAYWLHNHTDAAAYLSRSSEMLVEEHTDPSHDSLGNVYLMYGKTLLEISREAGDPLGDAVPKEVGFEEDVSDEEDEGGEDAAETADGETKQEDKPEEAKTEGDKKAVNKKDVKKANADEVKEGDDCKKDNKTDDTKSADISINGETATSTVENGDDSVMEEGVEEEEEEDDEGEEAVEDGLEGEAVDKEEEATDLQLAWEVLELAKVIFERRAEKGKEDFADCLVTLGEVSLESENFDSAITDIEAGLAIQKDLYKESKDMRKLAETYYKLGMAHSAHNKIDEGVADYLTTTEILKKRLKELEDKETPGNSDTEEIKEIKALLPELEEKIADLKNLKEEANKKPEEEPPMVSSPEKKATDISHLVKRKRKLVEDPKESVEKLAKKLASTSTQNKK